MNRENAIEAARCLLDIKAVKLSPSEPFTWASGRKSPIYCDNRLTLSYPSIRTFIRQQFVSLINEMFPEVDVIAGVATGGIAQGVLVAQDLGKPFVYVRPEAKNHGMKNQIEGDIKSGQTVMVVEDLISTGKSSLLAVDALRQAGCIVKGMVAVFTYELDVAKNNFETQNVPLATITNYSTLIETAVKEHYVSEEDLQSLNQWRENPEKWSDDRL
ncbi:MAG: orotate phosphoribosyltransferase [Bacteroidales bacterium]|nr:orotate phosphoribosyltransferase [Bacteroidales bacterium]MBQ9312891.1 orotate phosphoribosyltransferase [Bacteroidales bacterium]